MAGDLGHRPHDITEQHGRKADRKQQWHAAPVLVGGAGQQQHAQRKHQNAVQRDVGLAQRVLDQVDFSARLGRPDDQEPEERAKAGHQNHRIEHELAPSHAHGGGADHEAHRHHEEGVKGDVEKIGRTRKRVALVHPRIHADRGADKIKAQRHRQAGPGRTRRAPRHPRGGHGGDDDRDQTHGRIAQQTHVMAHALPAQAGQHEHRTDDDVDRQADADFVYPARRACDAFRLRESDGYAQLSHP